MSLQDIAPYVSFIGTIVQLAIALLLAALFQLLRNHAQRRPFFVTWSRAWLSLSLGLVAVVVRYNVLPSLSAALTDDDRPLVQGLYGLYQLGKLGFYAFLAGGVVQYVRGSLPAWLKRVLLVGIPLYVVISVWYANDLNQYVMVQAPAAVLATSLSAIILFLLPASRRSSGALAVASVSGTMALLWTVYFPAFGVAGPIMPEYPGPGAFGFLVHYNTYFDILTHLALGYSMIVLLMEDAKRQVHSVQAELAVAHDQQRRILLHDSVTGSLNQRAFDEGVGLGAARATFGAVLVLDVENLMSVNDRFGHAAGDTLLRYLVEQLRSALRRTDKLYRWGGDVFLLVLPGADARRVKARVADVLAGVPPLVFGPEAQRIPLLVCAGSAGYTSGDDMRAGIEQADADMRSEKHRRRMAGAVPHGARPSTE